MVMRDLAGKLAICAALVASSPAVAAPVTRTCAYSGPMDWKAVVVTLDESTRTVGVALPDGGLFVYRNGERSSTCPTRADVLLPPCPIADQFVTIRADRVEVGFRDPEDGSLQHMAYFPLTAFQGSAPCIWRSLWDFGAG